MTNNQHQNELKPCPFCGSDDVHIIAEYKRNCSARVPPDVTIIFCDNDDCGAPTIENECRYTAIKAWNSRAVPEESQLLKALTDIRWKTGVGAKPMLTELGDAIVEKYAVDRDVLREVEELTRKALSGLQTQNHMNGSRCVEVQINRLIKIEEKLKGMINE